MPSTLNMPSFEIEQDYIEIELPQRVYELVDVNTAIKQKFADSDFKFNIEADTISMKSVLTNSNGLQFNSELNILLGFTNTDYSEGIHKSEKPVMITTTDKVHLNVIV